MFNSDNKYLYIGASVYSINHGGLAIYVRYRKNPNEVKMIAYSSKRVMFRCPDRDLMFIGDSNCGDQDFETDWDEIIPVGPFWDNSFPGVMLNFTQYADKNNKSPNLRRHGRPEGSPIIMSDSGGFQIRSEQLDFVSTPQLAQWYNNNVDIGAVLDIPFPEVMWNGLVEKSAEVQALNTERIIENLNDRVELMNIVHGRSMEQSRIYHSIVDRPDINRLCIGCVYDGTLLQGVHHVTQVIQKLRSYKHYHILGVGKIQLVYAYMRLAAKGIAPLLTSDSSTWLQEGITKGYFMWPNIGSSPRYVGIGRITHKPCVNKILPCSCPICNAIKYQDVLSCFQGNTLAFIQSMHNLYAYNAFSQTMYNIINEGSAKEVKEIIKKQMSLSRTNTRDETLACIDYVDAVASKGIDYAARKLSYYLNVDWSDNGDDGLPSHTLFNQPTTDENEEGLTEEDVNIKSRIDGILDRYKIIGENKKAITKVKKKEKITKKRGHRKQTSKAVRHPGRKKKVKKHDNKANK